MTEDKPSKDWLDQNAEPVPMPRGGRRRQKLDEAKTGKKRHVQASSLANLRPYAPGVSGNPTGQSKTFLELTKQAREMSSGVLEKLLSIVHDPASADRDRINAASLILERGLGRPLQLQIPTTDLLAGSGDASEGDAAGLTALLKRARLENARRTGKDN